MQLNLMKAIKSDLEFELESYFQRRLSSSFHDQMEKIEKNEKSGKESERKIKPIKSSDGVKESKKRSIRKICRARNERYIFERITGHQSTIRKKKRTKENSVQKKNEKCFKRLLMNLMI